MSEFRMRIAEANGPKIMVKICNKSILYYIIKYYNKKNKRIFSFFYKKLKFRFPTKPKYTFKKEPNPKNIL